MADEVDGVGPHADPEDVIAEDMDLLADLKPKQQVALQALLREHSVAKVAEAIGVTDRTIYNWLNTPVFARAYRRFRRDAFVQAVGLTQRYAPLAVNTLAKILTDTNAATHAKVTAANSLLRFAREGIELDDLVARVEVLEGDASEEVG